MAKEFSKSVIISGGPGDHIPEYLREQPTLDYVENGRFDKKDAISKALPYKSVSQTDLPTTEDPPIIAFGSRNRNRLVALDRYGMVYDKDPDDAAVAGWDTYESNVIPTKNELLARNTIPSGRHADSATYNGYTVLAWDTYDPRENAVLPDTTVGFAVYDTNGLLVERVDIDDAVHPKLSLSVFNGNFFLHYLEPSTQDIYYYVVDSVDGQVISGPTLLISGGTQVDLPWVTLAGTNFPPTPGIYSVDDKRKREAWRTPYIRDGGNTGYYDVAFSEDGLAGVVLYNTAVGAVSYQRITVLGTADGSPVALSTTGSATEALVPLAVSIDNDGNVGTLISQYDTATRDCNAVFESFDDTDTTDNGPLSDASSQSYIYNGTLAAVNTGGAFNYAYSRADLPPWVERPTTVAARCSVVWGQFTNTLTEKGELTHQRLASKGVFFNDGVNAGIAVVLQQYGGAVDPGGESERNLIVRAQLYNKPVSSVMVLLKIASGDDNYKIMSLFDPAQSNQTPGSSKEQAMYLPSLRYLDEGDVPVTGYRGAFTYCNRVAQEPEDAVQYSTYTDGPNQDKRKAVLSPGQCEFRVYEAKRDVVVSTQEYGAVTVFGTGCPLVWDGDVLMELAPFDPPEMLYYKTWSGQAPNHIYHEVTHGGIDEWRQVTLTSNFVDGGNNLHRSAPAVVHWVEGLEAAEAAEPSSQIHVYNPISASGEFQKLFLEVYVGVATASPQLVDTEFLKVRPFPNFARSVIFTDRIRASAFAGAGSATENTEEVVRSSKAVYTEGELAADIFPSFKDFTIGSNRMAAISDTEAGVVYMSKIITGGVFPEFNGTLAIELGRNRALTAIEELDEKYIVFAADEMFVISNTGPDNTGANGDFFVDKLQTTVGTNKPESVVKTPDGLMFFSEQTQSFHLLTRDLQLIEIGQPVEDLTNSITNVWGSCLYADEEEVRFYVTGTLAQENGPDPNTDTGVPTRPPRPRYQNALPATNCCLVYNYEYKKWSVNTLPGTGTPVLVTTVRGRPAYITDEWEVYVQNDWSDDVAINLDADQRLKVRLSWIRSQNLQSFARFDELTFLGKYFSSWTKDFGGDLAAGDVQVKLYYDYAAEAGDTYRFRANREGDLGSGRMQFSVHPGQPRCQALQVELEEVATEAIEVIEPGYRFGQGWAIYGMDAVYKPKMGTGRKTNPQRSSK